MSVAPIFHLGTQFQVGNGLTARFWCDSWLLKEPLLEHTLQVIPEAVISCKVRDYRRNDGWRFEELIPFLPASILELLELAILNPNSDGSDMIIWKDSPPGTCSVRSAYTVASPTVIPRVDPYWEKIWKLKV